MAKIGTLVDNFVVDDTSSKWNQSFGVTVGGGKVTLPISASYFALISSVAYDLTASAAYCKANPAQGTDYQTYLSLADLNSSQNSVLIGYSDGQLFAQFKLAGTVTQQQFATWNGSTMAWWRIREASGTIFCEYSADSSTWTTLLSVADGVFPVTSVFAIVQSGYFGSGTPTGTSVVSNFNTVAGQIADPGPLGGNLLSYTDQSFETGTFSWTAANSNTTLFTDNTNAFTGYQSLGLKNSGTVAAFVTMQSRVFPVTPGTPISASAYGSLASASFLDWTIAFVYTNASGGTVSTDTMQSFFATAAQVWSPLQFASHVPAGATGVKMTIRSAANPGDSNHVDQVYLSTSPIRAVVDFTYPAIGHVSQAGKEFVDITPFIRIEQPLNITRGAQDSISKVQSGKATFTVDNRLGWFTPGLSTSPWFPNVTLGKRIQIQIADETGIWNTRFDGQIASYTAKPVVTGQTNDTQISCADVLSFLNRQQDLDCVTVESCRFLNPDLLYMMNEASGATQINDSSGNNGPALAPYTYSGPQYGSGLTSTAPTYSFASGNAPVEGAVTPTFFFGTGQLNTSTISSPLQSVYFSSTVGTSTTLLGASAQFEGKLPKNLTNANGGSFTVLGWFWPDVTVANFFKAAWSLAGFCLGNTRTGAALMVGPQNVNPGVTTNIGSIYFSNYLLNGAIAGPHAQIALNMQSFNGPAMWGVKVAGTTATLFIGGNLFGQGNTYQTVTYTIPSNVSFDHLSIGGMLGGGNGFIGNVSNINVWDSVALSDGELQNLGNVGAQGYYANVAGGVAGVIAGEFTSLPDYWSGGFDGGGEGADYYDISGQGPISAIDVLSQVVKFTYFVDAAGELCIRGRDYRMGAQQPITPSNVAMQKIATQNYSGSVTAGTVTVGTDSGTLNASYQQSSPGDMALLVLSATQAATFNVSDNTGNSWTLLGTGTSANDATYVYGAPIQVTLLPSTSKVNFTSTVNQPVMASLYRVPNVIGVDCVTTASATSAAVNVSTGTELGYYDFELAIVSSNSSAHVPSVPSGWNQMANTGVGTLRNDLFSRVNPDNALDTVTTIASTYASSTAWNAIVLSFVLSSNVLPPGSYDAAIAPKWNDQGMVNSETIGSSARPGNQVTVINQDSVDQYGNYPNGSPSNPTTAPYWVYFQGVVYQATIGGFKVVEVYETDYMNDVASWDVNTLGEPGMKLATVTCDILSNLPGALEYVPPSSLYSQEIGNLIQISESLQFFPDQPLTDTLFIEGVSETYSLNERSVTFYTSPAAQGLAWQPGSTLSGTLDQTARIGISGGLSDNVDGQPSQMVSPPAITSSMNVQTSGSNGYIGMHDVRGWSGNLQDMLTPPLAFLQNNITAQTLVSGAAAQIQWDTTVVDTARGYGQFQPFDYIVQLEGWYEVYLTVTFNPNTSAQRTAWIGQNQKGAVRKIAPVSIGRSQGTTAGFVSGVTTSGVFYCNIGDALSGFALQDSGGNLALSTSKGGSHMSIRYIGKANGRN